MLEIVSNLKSNKSSPLGGLLDRFLRAMHRHDGGRTLPLLHRARITAPQLAALEFVLAPRTVSEVADCLGLSRPATSQLLDKLERSGWLRRTAGGRDRRTRHVVLSAGGRSLVARIAAARAARFEAALAGLPPEVAAGFQSSLIEVMRALDAAPAAMRGAGDRQ
ncbi:MAG: MarR family transcriptional regulator [Nevskia sp.]|nr:MarR family transcriptional regulator [Nevskia sp.]